MKPILALLLLALPAFAQTATISDTLVSVVGGEAWTGYITVQLNSPSSAQPLYSGSQSLAGWRAVLCVGVARADCSVTTAAGAVSVVLYTNSAITPAGTSYAAIYQPTKGDRWNEVWVVAAGQTKLNQIRSTTTPTPATVISIGQISTAGATSGQGLIYNGSTVAWGSIGAEFTASAVIDLSPVVDGGCVLDGTAVTVTGAALGGRPTIGSSYQPPAGVHLFAKVTGPNSMRVEVCNLSGSSYDAGSATYYFGVK